MERTTVTMSNTLADYSGDHMWIMDGHMYNEVRVAHLTSENLALHDLFYGRITWIVRSDHSHSSIECIVGGDLDGRSTYHETISSGTAEQLRTIRVGPMLGTGLDKYCHCGHCNLG